MKEFIAAVIFDCLCTLVREISSQMYGWMKKKVFLKIITDTKKTLFLNTIKYIERLIN